MGEPSNIQSKPNAPEPEALHVQLSELNNRSRWYSSQLWHIPFAYFGILGVVVVEMIDNKASSYLPHVLIFIGRFGFFVLWHMVAIILANEETVKKLQETEGMLNLPQTVKPRPMNYMPLLLALVVIAVICLVYGLKML